jgi:hypothetical protein
MDIGKQREAREAELRGILEMVDGSKGRYLNPATVAPLVAWYLLDCSRDESGNARVVEPEERDLALTILAAL